MCLLTLHQQNREPRLAVVHQDILPNQGKDPTNVTHTTVSTHLTVCSSKDCSRPALEDAAAACCSPDPLPSAPPAASTDPANDSAPAPPLLLLLLP